MQWDVRLLHVSGLTKRCLTYLYRVHTCFDKSDPVLLSSGGPCIGNRSYFTRDRSLRKRFKFPELSDQTVLCHFGVKVLQPVSAHQVQTSRRDSCDVSRLSYIDIVRINSYSAWLNKADHRLVCNFVVHQLFIRLFMEPGPISHEPWLANPCNIRKMLHFCSVNRQH